MENPQKKLEFALDLIRNRVLTIEKILNISFEDIETWLQENRKNELQECERLFKAIDNNIFKKYYENKLLEFELRTWESVLQDWKNKYLELLKEFYNNHKVEKVA